MIVIAERIRQLTNLLIRKIPTIKANIHII